MRSRFVIVSFLGSLLALTLGIGASAATSVLAVRPPRVNFGTKPVGSFTVKGATVTNTSSETVSVLVTGERVPDDFSYGLLPGQTCPVLEPAPLAPGESCVVVMGFRPSKFFAGQKQFATLSVTATDPAGEVVDSLLIDFVGRGKNSV
jgi:hypothetical protein